ncbi:hypothetical protein EBB69_05865 [Lactobacillus delbrueckii]|nr:hypothetical protein [Lactobacillus delbrueckii]
MLCINFKPIEIDWFKNGGVVVCNKIRQNPTIDDFYTLPKKQQKTIMLLFSGEMNGSLSIKWTVFMKLVAF